MTTPLPVLILEDNPSDGYLMLNALSRAGFDPLANLVATELEFRDHLQPVPDIVLADFSLPHLSASDALRILKEFGLDIPCIIVSASHSEDRVAILLTEGAADYILKDDLGRLGPAVKQALEKSSCTKSRARRIIGRDTASTLALPGRWARTAVQRLLG